MPLLQPSKILEILKEGASIPLTPRRSEIEPIWIGRGIPAHIVTTSISQPDLTLLFVHGGGFTGGSTVGHVDLCARLADAAKAEVFSVDYRLAPEHPFPAAVEDCLSAYCHLLDEGCAPAEIIPVGLSAGGTLVLSMLLAVRDVARPMPAAAVLLSPAPDMLFLGESVISNRDTDWLTPRDLARIMKHYIADGDPTDPLASPLYADLRGLPPLLVQAGGDEILIDGIEAFVRAAELHEVSITFDRVKGMFHCWQMFAAVLPEGAEAVARIGEFIRRQVEKV